MNEHDPASSPRRDEQTATSPSDGAADPSAHPSGSGPSLPDRPVLPVGPGQIGQAGQGGPDGQVGSSTRGGGERRTRRVVAAVGVGAVGLAAGGILAGTLASSASAEDRSGSTGHGSGAYAAPGAEGRHGPDGPGGSGRPGGHGPGGETALTGTTRTKVLAAVQAKYPSATVQRVETDAGGVYEAHVLLAGKPTIVEVGKDFTVTGTETMPTRRGDHDGDGPEGDGAGPEDAPSTPAA